VQTAGTEPSGSRMAADTQSDVVAFLSMPQAFGLGAGATVERIDTHISTVWLAGDRAYKMKRAVRFDYVDFSTIQLRQRACDAEIRLNRRSAPDLYLGVRAVTREADGSFAIGGAGAPVEWLVEMRRFDQDMLFDRLAERGRLALAIMAPLADAIARLHASMAARRDRGGRAGMTWVNDGNALGFTGFGAGILDPTTCARLVDDTRAVIEHDASQLDARGRTGLVRECHGDLHLRNICLFNGTPTIFDGVEFNDDISCIDVLYDIAFLLMDLWRRDLRAHANVVFNDYLIATANDFGALGLFPLFLSCRAAVRAKTNATAAKGQEDAGRRRDLEAGARQYLELAATFLRPPPARLIAVGGFSGSGKSTLARSLAPGIGAVPGALVVRSDLLRKTLMGVDPLTHLGADGYAPAITQQVYGAIVERARAALQVGHSVVADAVFSRPGDRRAIAEAAQTAGVPFVGLWIDAPPQVLERRIATRAVDASDATAAVLVGQLKSGAGAIDWHRLDGAVDADGVLRQAHAIAS
jgi:uncharacterized protein